MQAQTIPSVAALKCSTVEKLRASQPFVEAISDILWFGGNGTIELVFARFRLDRIQHNLDITANTPAPMPSVADCKQELLKQLQNSTLFVYAFSTICNRGGGGKIVITLENGLWIGIPALYLKSAV